MVQSQGRGTVPGGETDGASTLTPGTYKYIYIYIYIPRPAPPPFPVVVRGHEGGGEGGLPLRPPVGVGWGGPLSFITRNTGFLCISYAYIILQGNRARESSNCRASNCKAFNCKTSNCRALNCRALNCTEFMSQKWFF